LEPEVLVGLVVVQAASLVLLEPEVLVAAVLE
jgi:hypothetical protein